MVLNSLNTVRTGKGPQKRQQTRVAGIHSDSGPWFMILLIPKLFQSRTARHNFDQNLLKDLLSFWDYHPPQVNYFDTTNPSQLLEVPDSFDPVDTIPFFNVNLKPPIKFLLSTAQYHMEDKWANCLKTACLFSPDLTHGVMRRLGIADDLCDDLGRKRQC